MPLDPGAEPDRRGAAIDEDGNVNPEVALILARNMLATLQDISADVKRLVPPPEERAAGTVVGDSIVIWAASDVGKRIQRLADRARTIHRDAERNGATTDVTLAEMREHADALADFADSVLVPF